MAQMNIYVSATFGIAAVMSQRQKKREEKEKNIIEK